jgi:hypothetical protein
MGWVKTKTQKAVAVISFKMEITKDLSPLKVEKNF